jgi:hypothetical protein
MPKSTVSSTNSTSTFSSKNFLSDITKDLIKELAKPRNKKRLQSIGLYIFDTVKLYLYTIILMLILAFVMNTAQFYYYISYVKAL